MERGGGKRLIRDVPSISVIGPVAWTIVVARMGTIGGLERRLGGRISGTWYLVDESQGRGGVAFDTQFLSWTVEGGSHWLR